MGYFLARLDKAVSVLYLARVGQFQASQNGVNYKDYWSNKRFAKEVVNSASQALDQAKIRLGATSLHLVGYSGGGGLAILLAQQRNDVLSVTTIAGLLDIDCWVKEKNFSPLIGSLNPASKAKTIKSLPQIHFFGTKDIIIPPKMSSHFQTLAPFNDFTLVEVDTNHWDLWIELSPELFEKHIVDLRKRAVLK